MTASRALAGSWSSLLTSSPCVESWVWPSIEHGLARGTPTVAWFQSGLLDCESAEAMIEVGMTVVHDCIACRRATISPTTEALPGQR